jgi:large subunit ribosomal protein L49
MSLLHSKRLVISSMLFREQYKRLERRLHPSYINKLIKTTKAPQPLLYKLHPYNGPVSLQKPNPEPLSPVEELPFSIERTASGNLPVYIKYDCRHVVKKTIIRKLSGDMNKFVAELQKVVSNHEIKKKVGKIEIPGVHKESVETWLLRLGL